jgi:hypothetical protein
LTRKLLVDLVDRHGNAACLVPAQVKLRDIDRMIPEESADSTNDSRLIVVANDEHVAFRRSLEPVGIDSHDSRILAPEDGSGHSALRVACAYRKFDQAGEVVPHSRERLCDMDAASFGDQRGIDLVDMSGHGVRAR